LNLGVFEEQAAPAGTREELVSLGLLVRRLRHARHWTQSTLAARTDVPQSTISRLERGQRPGLRAESLARLLFALGALENVDALAMRVQREHGHDWLMPERDRLPPWRRGDRAAQRFAPRSAHHR
jgi:transcriptional regulator with XRE-family HTH domain